MNACEYHDCPGGGGIWQYGGTLAVTRSVIKDNFIDAKYTGFRTYNRYGGGGMRLNCNAQAYRLKLELKLLRIRLKIY